MWQLKITPSIRHCKSCWHNVGGPRTTTRTAIVPTKALCCRAAGPDRARQPWPRPRHGAGIRSPGPRNHRRSPGRGLASAVQIARVRPRRCCCSPPGRGLWSLVSKPNYHRITKRVKRVENDVLDADRGRCRYRLNLLVGCSSPTLRYLSTQTTKLVTLFRHADLRCPTKIPGALISGQPTKTVIKG